jgi:hypothetical protein
MSAAQTAMVEVKYVNPPKPGKTFGSIKGTDNESWPVKADRIAEFEPNNKYEIAFVEGNNGFRNIIGVKRIVPRAEVGGRTHWTRGQHEPDTVIVNNVPPQHGSHVGTRNGKEYWQPKPPDPATARRIFICGLVNAWAHNGRIDKSVDAVVEAITIAGEAYDRMLGDAAA